MKLSELTTDETLDILCEITPCVEHIVKDEAILDSLGNAVNTDGMTQIGVLMAGVDRISTAVPVLLKTHRADVYGILAAVNRVDAKEIAGQKLTDTLTQIYDLLHDEDLLHFFRSFMPQGRKGRSAPSVPPPGSAQKVSSPPSQAS